MKSILYMLVNEEKSSFKIGITDNLEARHARLSAVWGNFDLASSCTVSGTRREISGLERTLHYMLDKWRFKPSTRADGHSEWFSIDCFDKAIDIITSVTMFSESESIGKINNGITIQHNKKNKPYKKITTIRKTFTEDLSLESIKQQWPIYEKTTLDFREHPQKKDEWLWTIDKRQCAISPFEVMLFNVNNRYITHITCQTWYTNEPHIIQVILSKKVISEMGKYDEFKPIYDFINVMVESLIEIGRRNAVPYAAIY